MSFRFVLHSHNIILGKRVKSRSVTNLKYFVNATAKITVATHAWCDTLSIRNAQRFVTRKAKRNHASPDL